MVKAVGTTASQKTDDIVDMIPMITRHYAFLNRNSVQEYLIDIHSADDKKFEELINVRNTADGLIHATKKTLEEAGDKASDEEKDTINNAIADLEEALKGDDGEDIKNKTTNNVTLLCCTSFFRQVHFMNTADVFHRFSAFN